MRPGACGGGTLALGDTSMALNPVSAKCINRGLGWRVERTVRRGSALSAGASLPGICIVRNVPGAAPPPADAHNYLEGGRINVLPALFT